MNSTLKQIESNEEALQAEPILVKIIGQYKGESWVRKMVGIAGLVPRDLLEHFGKYSFRYRNGSGRMIKNWVFEFEGERFYVSSANERGTQIDTTIMYDGDNEVVERFIEVFIEAVKNSPSMQFWLNKNK